MFQKKNKIFKTNCTDLDYSKPKIFFVGHPVDDIFSNIAPNYFSATTTLF